MPRSPAAPLVAIFLFAACHKSAAQSVFNTYPIDWAAVPSTPSPKNITSSCACDLTDNACDTGCCCDPSCPFQATNTTSKLGLCLPQGPADSTLDYCIASSSVQKVNLDSNEFFVIPEVPADNKYIDQLLCIVSSNNPNLGPQYPDPATGASGNNANLARCPLPLGEPGVSNNYQLASPIYVKDSVNLNVVRPLTVPFPALSAQCLNTYQPGFLDTIPSAPENVYSECLQPTQDESVYGFAFKSLCLDPFGPLSPLSYTNISYLSAPLSSNLAKLSVQVLSLDPVTGLLTPLGNASAPTYNSTLGVCSNALQYLNLTFLYIGGETNTPMTLTQVEASMVVTSLSRAAPSFTQFVRTGFVLQQPPGTPPLLSQQLSGTPGYLTGFPILAGSKVTTNSSKRGLLTAISRFTGGFPLPVGDANGHCSPSSLSPLRFGFNATSTCSVPLTLAQLQNYCVSNSSLPELNLQHVLGGFYTQLKNNNVYVGIWGNSNWTTPQEWIPVVQTKSSFSNLVWQNGRSCLNVVVGYDVQILTGLAFAANNAQQKVLYVNVCYRTATWSFPTTADPSQPQRFFMTSTVSVVPLDQSPYGVKKPAPPLATPLPEEIFYPFVTSGAYRVVSSLGLGALAMLAVIVSIFTYYF